MEGGSSGWKELSVQSPEVGTISAYKESKDNPPGVSLTGQVEQLKFKRQAGPGPAGPVVPGKEPGLPSGDSGKPRTVFNRTNGAFTGLLRCSTSTEAGGEESPRRCFWSPGRSDGDWERGSCRERGGFTVRYVEAKPP